MEPIPYYFDPIDRSALIVRPKKPFKDWLTQMDAARDYDVTQDADVYLIPDFLEDKPAEKWLSENFDAIFCDQCNNWYTDENHWPQKRTFSMFKQWFDYSIHLTILDTLDLPVKK